MGKNSVKKDSVLLDWEITDAPDPDEVVTSRPEAKRALRPTRLPGLSRRIWLLMSGVIVLAIGGISAFSAWDRSRIETEVRHLVNSQIFPPAWPNPLVLPANPASAEIQSITTLGNDTARAEVARSFRSPTGQPLTFTLAQFYEFNGHDWYRIDIPEAYWGPAHEYTGQRVWINYREIDGAFVTEFGPFVDDVLQRACAEWDCPPQLRLDLSFSTEAYSDRLAASPDTAKPNAFRLILAGVDVDQELRFPSPHLAGYPADAASQLALQQALALQTLIGLANELAGAIHQDNAYLYALTARLAARLGLEAANVGEGTTVPTLYSPSQLWEMAYARLWQSPATRDEALRAALGSLAVLLAEADRPAEREAQLFASLRQNSTSVDWYVEATGLAPTVARDVLQAALLKVYRVGPFATSPDLLLSCTTGPALYHLGEQRLIEFLSVVQGENTVVNSSWSPDGEWVTLFPPQSQRAYVINVASGEVIVQGLPATRSNNFSLSPQAWVSNTTLAYVVQRVRQPSLLRFLDITQTGGWPEMENVSAYVLAPDGQSAVIQRAQQLALIPPLGGQATPLGQGHSPQWSADGQALLFTTDSTPSDVTLVSYSLASGQTQRLLGSHPLGGHSIVEAAWSSTADRVALAMLEMGSDSLANNLQIRVGAISASEPQLQWRDSELARTVLALEFSADGKLLASLQYDQHHRSAQIVIYEVATGQRLRQLESVYAFAWSATGHRLAVSSASGVYLIAEAADQASPPRLLTTTECYHLVWNPAR